MNKDLQGSSNFGFDSISRDFSRPPTNEMIQRGDFYRPPTNDLTSRRTRSRGSSYMFGRNDIVVKPPVTERSMRETALPELRVGLRSQENGFKLVPKVIKRRSFLSKHYIVHECTTQKLNAKNASSLKAQLKKKSPQRFYPKVSTMDYSTMDDKIV